jgi:hypothetical protein
MPIGASAGTLDIENATLRSNAIAVLTNLVTGNDAVRSSGAPTLEVYGDPSHGGNEARLELVSNLSVENSKSFTRLTSNAGVFSIQSGTDASTNGPITFGGFSNERMRITADGNVGIGTTDPMTALDVLGTIRVRTGTNDATGGEFSIDTNVGHIRRKVDGNGVSLTSYDDFQFYVNATGGSAEGGTQAMIIDNSGNVGIGTASPTDRLDVHYPTPSFGSFAGTEEGSLTVSAGAEHSNAVVYFRTPFDAAAPAKRAIFSDGGSFSGGGNGGLHFCLESSNDNTTKVDLTDSKMMVRHDGNVGIGRTNPGYLLDLYRNATNGAVIRMESSGGSEATISKKSSSSSDQSLQFTNDKATGVNPSYQFLSNPGSGWRYNLAMMGDGRLAMNGNSITHPKNGVLTIYSTNEDKLVDQFVFKACIDTNVIGFFLNAAGTARGSINGTNASSIQYATTSDERLKKQIKPMQTTLDRVNALKPCTYTWIRDEAKGYGFIAQEVHKVFPEMKPVVPYSGCTCKCGEKKCESCTLCDDEHDYPKNKDGTDFHYGLDYGQFTPFLTKAIQELDAKVEEHHNRKSLVTGVEYSKIGDYEGLIVSATTNEYRNARPVLTLSNTENDKKCYGVILGKSNSIDNKTNIQKSGDPT